MGGVHFRAQWKISGNSLGTRGGQILVSVRYTVLVRGVSSSKSLAREGRLSLWITSSLLPTDIGRSRQ